MHALTETIDGDTLWARRRAWPGDGGLMWHMSRMGCIEPVNGDLGLMTGSLEEMADLARRLTAMRTARGMRSTVSVVRVG